VFRRCPERDADCARSCRRARENRSKRPGPIDVLPSCLSSGPKLRQQLYVQKMATIPTRRARELRMGAAGSLGRVATGTKRSPNAFTFARPIVMVGELTPNVRSH
jgi:hypothetical protein